MSVSKEKMTRLFKKLTQATVPQKANSLQDNWNAFTCFNVIWRQMHLFKPSYSIASTLPGFSDAYLGPVGHTARRS